jgi:hypothetical protein
MFRPEEITVDYKMGAPMPTVQDVDNPYMKEKKKKKKGKKGEDSSDLPRDQSIRSKSVMKQHVNRLTI